MENKKRFSILKVVISIIAIIFIIISVILNVTFSGGKTPHLFGKYFYLVDKDSTNEGVTANALIIAEEAEESNLAAGKIILCYPDGYSQLQVRGIGEIVQGEDGQNKYALCIGANSELDSNGDRVTVTADKVAAICSGNPQSIVLGRYIRFSISIKGILLQLILPCVILVIFIIAKIASSSDKDEQEEGYGFYEYDGDEADESAQRTVPSHEKQNGPLFEPSQEIQPSDEFERKKMSIADHFRQKEVDHNSSYQKEKERTMQFKTQRSSGPESPSENYRARHRQSSAESSFAARNMGGQSSTAPTADALREEMLRKTAEAERTAQYNTRSYGQVDHSKDSVSDVTGVYSKAQLAEMAAGSELPKTAPLKPKTPVQQPTPARTVRKAGSSSPDIDDIIAKSETESKKKNISDMSVDDLLQMIEDEKKKL